MSTKNYNDFIIDITKRSIRDRYGWEASDIVKKINSVIRKHSKKGKIEVEYDEYDIHNAIYSVVPTFESAAVIEDLLNILLKDGIFEVGKAEDVQGNYYEIPPILYHHSINGLNELLRLHKISIRVVQYDGDYDVINI